MSRQLPYVVFDRRKELPTEAAAFSRYVVYCWTALPDYAHSKAPDSVVEILAVSAESAQESARGACNGHYEAFETHTAASAPHAGIKGGYREGMTFEEFRNFHEERMPIK